MKRFVILLLLPSLMMPTQAQDSLASSPIIFIYDASGSMWGQLDGRTKMELASTVLSDALDKLSEEQQMGLVAYGHRREEDCEDVEFLINMHNQSKEQIRQALKNIKPLGRTPLAYSAIKVIEQLRVTKTKATIILVTDGIEVCGGDLCAVIRQAKLEGIDFKLHIIGFGLEEANTASLKCAAEAGDGQYYYAADAGSLIVGLEEATTATIDKTEYVQPAEPENNFSVYAIKNGAPVDSWVVAYAAGTRKEISNTRTYGDTSYLSLPPGEYDLEFGLSTSDIQGIVAYNMKSFPDSIGHKTMSFDAGKVRIMTTKDGEGWDSVVEIYSPLSGKRVAAGRTYGSPDIHELNPGIYDIKVTAMRLKGAAIEHRFENVDIKGNEVQDVSHDFKSGTLIVYTSNNGEGWDCTISITSKANGRKVAGGRTYGQSKSYLINPGMYEVEFGAMRMIGPEIKSQNQIIEVTAKEEIKTNYDFKSGILKIGARSNGTLVAATVNIIETKSGKYFNGGRTSTEASGNPKQIVISSSSYTIVVTDIKSHQKKEFSVDMKAGDVVEKMIEF